MIRLSRGESKQLTTNFDRHISVTCYNCSETICCPVTRKHSCRWVMHADLRPASCYIAQQPDVRLCTYTVTNVQLYMRIYKHIYIIGKL